MQVRKNLNLFHLANLVGRRRLDQQVDQMKERRDDFIVDAGSFEIKTGRILWVEDTTRDACIQNQKM